ncbi:MAG: hypothetical protein QXT28_12620 [Thermofilaceae archaeon]
MIDVVVYFCVTWLAAWLFFFTKERPLLRFLLLLAWLGLAFIGFVTAYSYAYAANPTLTSAPSAAEKAEVLRYTAAVTTTLVTSAVPVLLGIFEWLSDIERRW